MSEDRDDLDVSLDLHLDADRTAREDWQRDFRKLLVSDRRRAEEVVAALECRNRTVRTKPIWELSNDELIDAGLLARDLARCLRTKKERNS